jgi:hypothetical protein
LKPETKRRLAIEWLTLLCSTAVAVCLSLWSEVPSKVNYYWEKRFNPAWFQDVSRAEIALYHLAPYEGETFPQDVPVPAIYKDSYLGHVRALKYAFRESLPESVFLGVLLGIGIYIVLWIPRMTLRAIRIVKAKPSVT